MVWRPPAVRKHTLGGGVPLTDLIGYTGVPLELPAPLRRTFLAEKNAPVRYLDASIVPYGTIFPLRAPIAGVETRGGSRAEAVQSANGNRPLRNHRPHPGTTRRGSPHRR
jgi:hypothetical protein